jgi:methyl acetate hydrolase
LLFEPGTQWIYGTGVDWLGRLVETRRQGSRVCRERIFTPLAMSDTFNVPDAKQRVS